MNCNWFRLILRVPKVKHDKNLLLKSISVIFNIDNTELIIENNVEIRGATLEDGCVVGAGVVAAGQFKNNCVIVGNRTKIIKRLGVDGVD